MTDTITTQLAALTTIRRLLTEHFPDYSWLLDDLQREIAIDDDQDIEFDDNQDGYVLINPPACKVCGMQSRYLLIEVPTRAGKFYICTCCQKDIATAKTLATKEVSV